MNEAAAVELSVVVPVYNEEENLRELHRRLGGALGAEGLAYEVLFVDDGSRDGSLEVIRALAAADPRVRYASFSRNFGHEAASSCGLRMARGRAVALMDADLQDPPELLPEMVARWRAGADVVYGRRRSRAGEGALKRGTSYLFYRLMNRFGEVPLPVDAGDFRLADRRVVDAFNALPERSRFVRGMFAWVGYRQEALEYERPGRAHGVTKYNWTRLALLSLDAFCGFSLAPLRLCILAGAVVTGLSFLVTAHIVYARLFSGLEIPGYALATAGMFFLGGLQLTFLGVIGEYVGKIFAQVQGRPLYLVREQDGRVSP